MVELDKKERSIVDFSLEEIQRKMYGKIMQVSIGDSYYCFKILKAIDIINGSNCFLELKRGFNNDERIYGFLKYKNVILPVFFPDGIHGNINHSEKYNSSVIVMDVSTEGLRSQVGLMINSIDDLINSSMNEIDNRVLRGRM